MDELKKEDEWNAKEAFIPIDGYQEYVATLERLKEKIQRDEDFFIKEVLKNKPYSSPEMMYIINTFRQIRHRRFGV